MCLLHILIVLYKNILSWSECLTLSFAKDQSLCLWHQQVVTLRLCNHCDLVRIVMVIYLPSQDPMLIVRLSSLRQVTRGFGTPFAPQRRRTFSVSLTIIPIGDFCESNNHYLCRQDLH